MVEEGTANAVQFSAPRQQSRNYVVPTSSETTKTIANVGCIKFVSSSVKFVVWSPEVAVSGVNQFHTLEL